MSSSAGAPDRSDDAAAHTSPRGRWQRRAWRTLYGFLFVTSLLEAAAHYPDLSFHGFLGALPWPMYLVFAAGWAFLWWEVGRGR